MRKIHDCLGDDWKKVYCAHPRDSSIWNDFRSKYGQHIPKATFEDRPCCAEDFICLLNRMKDSAAGFDGRTKDALKLLPTRAWHHRAQIENMAK